MPSPSPTSKVTTFAHAMDAFRESLILLAQGPHPETILPALWAFGDAGRQAGLTAFELTAIFHALYDGADTELPPAARCEGRRRRLLATLLTIYLPPTGYLATE